jgi:hypothetical protein
MAHLPQVRVAAALVFVAGVLACAGCGDGRKPVFTVRGKVLTADKKPAVSALVTFHPATADPKDPARPVGRVDEQGEYKLTTYTEHDGAPAGEYTITVVWPAPKKTPFEPEGPDRLGGRLARPDRSPHKVTVESRPDQEAPTIILP